MTTTEVKREEPPSLEFRTPECPLCNNATQREDDGYSCENCECAWNRDGSFFEWDDANAEQCETTVQPWAANSWISESSPNKYRQFRCTLSKGHEVYDWSRQHAHADVNGVMWAKGWR